MRSTIRLPLLLVGMAACVSGAAHADARDEVMQAFRSAMADGSYRMSIEVDNRRGPVKTQLDVQMPDRFHMKSAEAEFVIVPGGTWINAGGRWMRVPVDMSAQMQGFRIQDLEQAGELSDVQKLGREDVGGCASDLYRYRATSQYAGRKHDADIELAVCSTSGKPVRVRSTPTAKGDPITILYDFETPIDIKAPQ